MLFFTTEHTNTRKGILARLCLVSVYSVCSVVPRVGSSNQEELDGCLNCGSQCPSFVHRMAFATDPSSWPSTGSL